VDRGHPTSAPEQRPPWRRTETTEREEPRPASRPAFRTWRTHPWRRGTGRPEPQPGRALQVRPNPGRARGQGTLGRGSGRSRPGMSTSRGLTSVAASLSSITVVFLIGYGRDALRLGARVAKWTKR